MRHTACSIEREPLVSTTLPLLERAAIGSVTLLVTPSGFSPAPPAADGTSRMRLPLRRPESGEQYRFHVDMGRCIGCKCCVVACNEQNGNPAAITWRRVTEIEGGWYPQTSRAYLSMGCNHCLEPTCLSGCPVDAYSKDPVTGIVLHSAEACIGCQYCTWNCSYGVPQYNPERGVVGKCDLCHGRLALGQSPACVSACPTGAIQVEIIKVADWRRETVAAPPISGMPLGDHSASTTRVTLPANLPPNAKPADLLRLSPAEPHWPLIVMTVFTQLSVGAFTTIWLLQVLGTRNQLSMAALLSLLVGAVALAASTLHLGRPIHAYRAVKMWRRSWLSREVALFTGFAGVAGIYAVALWLGAPGAPSLGAVTVLLGVGGVTASACIYRVPSRPAWHTPFTNVQFHLTAAVLGPLFVVAAGAGVSRWLAFSAAAVAGLGLVVLALRYFQLSASDSLERRASAQLLATMFAPRLIARGGLLAMGAIVLPLATARPAGLWLGFALALGAEVLGRYLFFVSAVPRHMAAPYIANEAA